MPRLKRQADGSFVASQESRSETSDVFSMDFDLCDTEVPGSIEYVQLRNFMCHESLTYQLDRVNLLTGANGSGKSSILQAIVIGLGGAAKDTKRSTKLSQFIQRNERSAKISIALRNVGDSAWRPEIYGERVIIERIIFEKSSKFTIRNSQNRVLYENRRANEERGYILDNFHIDIENPIVVLQQEHAKKFLSTENSHSMYEFFERSTLLKTFRDEYKKAYVDVVSAKEELVKLKERVEKRSDELQELERKRTGFEKLRQLIGNQEKYRQMHFWMEYRKKLQYAERKQRVLVQKKEEMEQRKDQIDKLNAKLIDLQSRLAQAKTAPPPICDTDERQLLKEMSETKLCIRSKKLEFDEVMRKWASLDKELFSIKTLIDRENDRKEVANELSLQGMMRKKEELEMKLLEIDEKTEKLTKEKENRQHDLDFQKDRKASLLADSCRLDILSQEQRKMLAKDNHSPTIGAIYGSDVERLEEEIQRQASKFRRQPIGPIGNHISLLKEAVTNRDLSALIENELGSFFLRGFLVDNFQDRKLLESIMEGIFRGTKKPMIYQSAFLGRRHFISNKKAGVYPETPNILDYLDFNKDDVFNIAIDIRSLEGTLVLNEEKAQQLMSDPKLVPKNARQAITTEFYRYTPATAWSSYGSYYIRRNYRTKNYLQASNATQMCRLKHAISKTNIEIKENQNEIDNTMGKLKTINIDIIKLTKKLVAIKNEKIQVTVEKKNIERNLKEFSSASNITELKAEEAQKRAELSILDETMNSLKNELEQLKAEESDKTNILKEKRRISSKVEEKQSEQKRVVRELQSEIKIVQKDIQELSDSNEKEQEFIETLAERIEELGVHLQKEEEKAMKKSGGKRVDLNGLSDVEIETKYRHFQAAVQQLEARMGIPEADLLIRTTELVKENGRLNRQLKNLENEVNKLELMNQLRLAHCNTIRNLQAREVRRRFIHESRQQGLQGSLKINHELREAKITVGRTKSLSTLSGGERSKTTMCLLFSLSDSIAAPFVAYDEWDVFLDAPSRAQIEELLIRRAKETKNRQFLFLSPQQSSIFDEDDEVQVIRVGD